MISAILNNIPLFKIYTQSNARSLTRTPVLEYAGQPEYSTRHTHKVNRFEKKMLVWTGKYKTAEEVPAFIAPEVMERARSRTRIRLANSMMALTLVGCAVMVYLGKRSHEQGDSLEKRNLEMHRKYNEEHGKNAAK